jgi:hypothetical protein
MADAEAPRASMVERPLVRRSSSLTSSPAASLVVALLSSLCAGRSRSFALRWRHRSEDGQLDISNWLIERKGFLPVPIVITEPAVGLGGGVA